MKKLLIATVMIAAVSFAGIQTVSAYDGYYDDDYGYCDNYGGGNSYMRGDDDGKYQKFRKETIDIRKEIAVKRSELKAINRQDNPDEKRAAQLTGELFDLKEKLAGKASEAGISGRFNRGPSMMRNGGWGRGRGNMMGGGYMGRGRYMDNDRYMDRGRSNMMDW